MSKIKAYNFEFQRIKFEFQRLIFLFQRKNKAGKAKKKTSMWHYNASVHNKKKKLRISWISTWTSQIKSALVVQQKPIITYSCTMLSINLLYIYLVLWKYIENIINVNLKSLPTPRLLSPMMDGWWSEGCDIYFNFCVYFKFCIFRLFLPLSQNNMSKPMQMKSSITIQSILCIYRY